VRHRRVEFWGLLARLTGSQHVKRPWIVRFVTFWDSVACSREECSHAEVMLEHPSLHVDRSLDTKAKGSREMIAASMP
jgi:hypothetical protein